MKIYRKKVFGKLFFNCHHISCCQSAPVRLSVTATQWGGEIVKCCEILSWQISHHLNPLCIYCFSEYYCKKYIAFGQDMCYIICPSIQDYLLMSRTQFFNKNVWFFWKIVVKSMSLVIQTYFRCKLSLLQLHLMTFDDALFMVTRVTSRLKNQSISHKFEILWAKNAIVAVAEANNWWQSWCYKALLRPVLYPVMAHKSGQFWWNYKTTDRNFVTVQIYDNSPHLSRPQSLS